jgi:thiol-disulfide isomerase/thioredoxin
MDPKTIIDVTVYEIDSKTQLETYTATWCAPCTRIKPKVIEIMHNYKKLSETQIDKPKFQSEINKFVPFFVVMKYKDIDCAQADISCEVLLSQFTKTDSIQTSDSILFKQFLTRNGIGCLVLDDNF